MKTTGNTAGPREEPRPRAPLAAALLHLPETPVLHRLFVYHSICDLEARLTFWSGALVSDIILAGFAPAGNWVMTLRGWGMNHSRWLMLLLTVIIAEAVTRGSLDNHTYAVGKSTEIIDGESP